MPISLKPFSRRNFIKGSLGAAAGAMLASCGREMADRRGDEPRFLEGLRDANRLALFSDTHINAKPATVDRGNNMSANLEKCIAEVLKVDYAMGAPSAVLVNGDLSHRSGETGDYIQFLAQMTALTMAGIPVHLALGNHDHRERFWGSVTSPDFARRNRVTALESQQVLRLYTPTADILMLDSLEKTLQTPGSLGEAQLAWLKSAIDDPSWKHRNVIVFVHHNPPLPAPAAASAPATQAATQAATKPKFIGLTDGQELLDLLLPRRRVKALFYGHTHQWKRTQIDGMHIVNIPSMAYAFGPEPLGWTDCRLYPASASLELRCVEPSHARHGDKVDLKWRA
jgi:3',5'-cyclic AMP phosphodiesterase CpdA